MGFDFGEFKDDVGGFLQKEGTSFLQNELANRLNPVKQEPPPPSTLTVAQNDATKIGGIPKNTLYIYAGGALAAILLLVFAFKSKGGRRGK